MHDILVRIPSHVGSWSLFGNGAGFWAWLIGCAAWIVWRVSRRAPSNEIINQVPVMVIVAVALRFVLPSMLVVTADSPEPFLPIRGYGVMVTLGVISAVWLVLHEARRWEIDIEVLLAFALPVVIAGVVGARLFYVIQYWPEYQSPSWFETAKRIVNFTQGGLVVYGAFLAGAGVGVFLAIRRGWRVLALADLIAPSMMVGLAFGRVGCFLHGCCYAGACDPGSLTVTFPRGSPPFEHQLALGQLYGVTLGVEKTNQSVVVRHVDPTGPAANAGLETGDVVVGINGRTMNDSPPWFPQATGPARMTMQLADGRSVAWDIKGLPARSLPAQPVQIYSALHAAALAFFLWSWYPRRRRDGELTALLLTFYPVGRILEELIRDDEPGRLGTSLTISQWVSVLVLVGAAVLWTYLLSRPKTCQSPLP